MVMHVALEYAVPHLGLSSERLAPPAVLQVLPAPGLQRSQPQTPLLPCPCQLKQGVPLRKACTPASKLYQYRCSFVGNKH